jgi:hypothetical protein
MNARLTRAAERAWRDGRVVVVDDVMVVPDTVILEGHANGLPDLPPSWMIERAGRRCYLGRVVR